MQKGKLIFVFVILIGALLLTGCGALLLFESNRPGQNYYLVEDMDTIRSVEIVYVGEISKAFVDDKELEVQTTLCVVDDIEGFCEDFRNLDAGWTGAEAASIMDNVTAIKIIYTNGEYALVHWLGTSRYYDGAFRYYCGTDFYDEEEFNALIDKYMKTEDDSSTVEKSNG